MENIAVPVQGGQHSVLEIVQYATQGYGSNQHPVELMRYLHWLSALRPKYIVEVGVESGGTSWAVRQVCPDSIMLSVDVNRPKHFSAIQGNTRFFQGFSNQVDSDVRKFYDPNEALVFIDADHHYKSVVEDTKLYPAKYQAYHDISWQPGNEAPRGESVDRFYAEHRDCCFIHEFVAGWAGIGVRMPKFCKQVHASSAAHS